jgi:hypothetical protein
VINTINDPEFIKNLMAQQSKPPQHSQSSQQLSKQKSQQAKNTPKQTPDKSSQPKEYYMEFPNN